MDTSWAAMLSETPQKLPTLLQRNRLWVHDLDQRLILVIFVPSRVRLYMSPLPSKMKPTIGLATLLESIEPPMPTVIKATEPSTPTFQPRMRLNPSRASGVMKTMMTERACAPSWKPNEAETVL